MDITLEMFLLLLVPLALADLDGFGLRGYNSQGQQWNSTGTINITNVEWATRNSQEHPRFGLAAALSQQLEMLAKKEDENKCYLKDCGCPPAFKASWCKDGSTTGKGYCWQSQNNCEQGCAGTWCPATSSDPAKPKEDTESDEYELTEEGMYCTSGHDILAETDCRAAADALGKTWGWAWDGEGDHKYCSFADDNWNRVFFNRAGSKAAVNPPRRKYASVCFKEPGRIPDQPKEEVCQGNPYQTYDHMDPHFNNRWYGYRNANAEDCEWQCTWGLHSWSCKCWIFSRQDEGTCKLYATAGEGTKPEPAPVLPARPADALNTTCSPTFGASASDLIAIGASNCDKVYQAANTQYGQILAYESDEIQESWKSRLHQAWQLCNTVDRNDLKYAKIYAVYALEAWSTQLMRGHECCDSITPPFCHIDAELSHYWLIILAAIICLIVWISPKLLPKSVSPHLLVHRKDRSAPQLDEASGGGQRAAHDTNSVMADLSRMWDGHSLHVLPSQELYRDAAVKLFEGLRRTFGFQGESVKNQFEHLLSMWRSQVSVVGDYFYESKTFEDHGQASRKSELDEVHKQLLREGLKDLHADLLAGFQRWRRVFRDCDKLPKEGANKLGGAMITTSEVTEGLPEIAAYLLIWGEAGNLRFMPELICFLTDLALAADPPGRAILGSGDVYEGVEQSHRSRPFLVHIVRPIYRTIFDESYQHVLINEANQKTSRSCIRLTRSLCLRIA